MSAVLPSYAEAIAAVPSRILREGLQGEGAWSPDMTIRAVGEPTIRPLAGGDRRYRGVLHLTGTIRGRHVSVKYRYTYRLREPRVKVRPFWYGARHGKVAA